MARPKTLIERDPVPVERPSADRLAADSRSGTKTSHEPARLLSNAEAARFLNLSPRTLEKLRVTGGGPTFRKLLRRVSYSTKDLQSWIDERACESTVDANYRRSR